MTDVDQEPQFQADKHCEDKIKSMLNEEYRASPAGTKTPGGLMLDPPLVIGQASVAPSTKKMADVENAAGLQEFIATGRTGRRNAIPDILSGEHSSVETGSLPYELEKLNCSVDISEQSKSSTACSAPNQTGTNPTGGSHS